LDVLKWPIIAGFVGVFVIGAIFLARKPVAISVAEGTALDSDADAVPQKNARRKESSRAPQSSGVSSRAQSIETPAVILPPTSRTTETPREANLERVDAAVATSLDALKEQLFRLELRHQAGTISDADYATERARAEKVLRDLVRG
jgi:hypothetical protein